ncbi:MAG: hypothetical protein H7259_02395 [Cytophagales bacterium]|nr:hypothetical protein [Cytophaga sp.]
MKKVMYTLMAFSMIAVSAPAVNADEQTNYPSYVLSPQMSTTDIFNYVKSNLGLTPAQEPEVKTAVDETGGQFANLSKTASSTVTKEAEKKLMTEFTKKISSLLTGAQSTKLTGISSTLLGMFSQLKK